MGTLTEALQQISSSSPAMVETPQWPPVLATKVFFIDCCGGRIGDGGDGHGGRYSYDDGYGYNHHNDYIALFNGPRFNPNLGAHPPNYGPSWDYERGRGGRHDGNGGHRWNGGFWQGHNCQRHFPQWFQRVPPQGPPQHQVPAPPQMPNQSVNQQQQVPQPPPVASGMVPQPQSVQPGLGVEQHQPAAKGQQQMGGERLQSNEKGLVLTEHSMDKGDKGGQSASQNFVGFLIGF